MCTKEIITLQIGHYSNFIGTHWWNNQESLFCYNTDANKEALEINHDVLFRQGQNPRGEVTYTPRLVAVDLKGSLNSLKKDGILYEMPPQKTSPIWQGKLGTFKSETASRNEFLQDLAMEEDAVYPDITHKMAAIDEDRDICQAEPGTTVMDSGIFQSLGKNKLYDLDESVNVWSDFLRIHFHPRSLCVIEEYSQEDKFSSYGCGLEAYSGADFSETIEDTVRYYAEECDFLQGFNILMDGHNGFTAVGNNILQHLKDSYSSKAQLCFPVYSPMYKLWNRRRVASNEATQLITSIMGFDGAIMYSNLFSPLYVNDTTRTSNQDFPYLKYKPELPYHTSAILSLALDTATLPMRLKQGSIVLSEVINGLSVLGQKLAVLSLCAPLPIQDNGYLYDVLKNESNIKLTSLTPLSKIDGSDVISQFVALRGIPESRFYSHNSPSEIKMPIETLFGLFLKNSYPRSINFCKVVKEASKTVAPFPHIFDTKITSQGYIGRTDRPKDAGVHSISTMGGFHNVNSTAESLDLMLELAHASKLQKSSIQFGIECDDFQDAIENVKMLTECYKDS